LWLDAMTHEGERISIIIIHQATARHPDLERRMITRIQAEMKKSEGRRKIMGGDLNGATSRTGDSISRKSHFEKINNQLQDFFQRTGGSLIQSHLSVYGTAHPTSAASVRPRSAADCLIRSAVDISHPRQQGP